MNIFDRLGQLKGQAQQIEGLPSEAMQIIDDLIDEALEIHQLGVRILNLNIQGYEQSQKPAAQSQHTSLDK